jgi:NADPH-dependent curcumin reductase
MPATQIRLNARPKGKTDASTWKITHDAPPPVKDGEIAVAVEYVSVDPAMRGWLNDVKSYVPPVGIGEVMRASGAGRVTESKASGFAIGDAVMGQTGVQSHCVGAAAAFSKADTKLAPLPAFLSGFGLTGMTAYFGLKEVGQIKTGETVVISAAAGAVGSMAGQIARNLGCRVVGIAGDAEKCRLAVEEFGYDACIDYRAGSVSQGLKEHCPKGIDVYFDNVGGKILENCLNALAMHARVVLCGAISQYNAEGERTGPSNYMQLLVARARMEGFVVIDYRPQFPGAIKQLATWRDEGKFTMREHIVNGLDQFGTALNMLFTGENKGKLIIKV